MVVSNLPSWFLLLSIVAVTTTLAIVVQVFVRRRYPKLRGEEHNDVTKFAFGVVGLFDPRELAELLEMPPDAEPVAVLCLGPVPEFPARPMLEIGRWAVGRPLAEFVSENTWPNS